MPAIETRDGTIPAIIGAGGFVPRRVVTNEEIDGLQGRKKGFTDRAMRITGAGMEERHWVEPGIEAASDLATGASLEAIAMSRRDKHEIKAIISGTSTPDYIGVSTAGIVQHNLGLSTEVRCYDLGAACTGWVQAIKNGFTDLTSDLGDGGPQLIIGAEVLSPFLDPKQGNVFPLFGDGGGATLIDLVKPDPGAPTEIKIKAGSDGSLVESLYMPAGGSRLPTSAETVEKGLHTLFMDSNVVREQAVKRMVEYSKKVLEEAGYPIEEVSLVITHQANLAIVHDVTDGLNIPFEKAYVTINKYGNTSASSIPMAIVEAYREGKLKRNDILLVATFGATFLFAAGIIPMVGLPKAA